MDPMEQDRRLKLYDLLLKRFTSITDLRSLTARHYVTVSGAVLTVALLIFRDGNQSIPSEDKALVTLAASTFILVSGAAVTMYDAKMRARAAHLADELEDLYAPFASDKHPRHSSEQHRPDEDNQHPSEQHRLDEDKWYHIAQTTVPQAFVTLLFLNSLILYLSLQLPWGVMRPAAWGWIVLDVALLPVIIVLWVRWWSSVTREYKGRTRNGRPG